MGMKVKRKVNNNKKHMCKEAEWHTDWPPRCEACGRFIKRIENKIYSDSEPMSKNNLFDNSRNWLEDEPWRTW